MDQRRNDALASGLTSLVNPHPEAEPAQSIFELAHLPKRNLSTGARMSTSTSTIAYPPLTKRRAATAPGSPCNGMDSAVGTSTDVLQCGWLHASFDHGCTDGSWPPLRFKDAARALHN